MVIALLKVCHKVYHVLIIGFTHFNSTNPVQDASEVAAKKAAGPHSFRRASTNGIFW